MKKVNSTILVLVIFLIFVSQTITAQPLFNTISYNEKGSSNTSLKNANSNTSFKFKPYLLSFENSISAEQINYLQHRQIFIQLHAEMERKLKKSIADLNNDLWVVDEEEDLQMENWMLDPNEWLSTN